MDFRKRMGDIAAFLRPFEGIWQHEIMLDYPTPFDAYPKAWLDDLASITAPRDVIRLEKKDVEGLIKNPDLLAYYHRIAELTSLPSIPQLPPMPETPFTFLYVIPKKQYEVRTLAPYVQSFYAKRNLSRIIDIGGGIGVLAQTLNNQYGLPITSVDMDPELQKTGSERHHKNAKDPNNKVHYETLKVAADEPKFLNLLQEKSMTVGLHTCGPLALDQLRASAMCKLPGLINFGCCYQRLCDDHQNVSAFAQSIPYRPVMNQYALTLASRAHRKMPEKDYVKKQKVKHYRYAIQFLLVDEYDISKTITLGNSHPRLYDADFATYAQEQFQRIGVSPKHTTAELNSFYTRAETQELIWRMLAAGLIRNALGRVLEVYLLLDRAILLEEAGYSVKLEQFFDEEVSPRNIGLVATSSRN